MTYSKNRFNKVKKLARLGWRSGPKPFIGKKKARKLLSGAMTHAKRTARGVAKTAAKRAVKYGKGVAKDIASGAISIGKERANTALDAAIRSAGAAGSVTTANPGPSLLAEAAIVGKDMLLQKYFGTQHNRGSSHSGRNYAVKRKAAVRYHADDATPAARSERLIRKGAVRTRNVAAAAFRNSNHLYSADHPTGGKI